MTNAANAGADPEAAPEPHPSPARKPHRRGRAACFIGFLLGLLGLGATRLGWLWIDFDVFAQFTLQFAVVTLAFFIGYWAPRARVLTAVVLIVAGVLAIGVWPHLAASQRTPPLPLAAGEKSLKLMTFNTWYGNGQVEEVGAELRRQNADIVFLAEFGPNKRGLIAAMKDMWPYHADCFEADFCNLALLSKYRIVKSEGKPLWKGPPYLRAEFGPELGGLIVTGAHTIRFPHQQAQFTQFRELAALIGADAGRPRIAMGDFNTTAFSRMMDHFITTTGMRRITFLPTWPATLQLPQLGIDHIFLDGRLRALDTPAIGGNAGSDHFPVVATVAVRVE